MRHTILTRPDCAAMTVPGTQAPSSVAEIVSALHPTAVLPVPAILERCEMTHKNSLQKFFLQFTACGRPLHLPYNTIRNDNPFPVQHYVREQHEGTSLSFNLPTDEIKIQGRQVSTDGGRRFGFTLIPKQTGPVRKYRVVSLLCHRGGRSCSRSCLISIGCMS